MNAIRDNPAAFDAGLARRGILGDGEGRFNAAATLALDERRRSVVTALQEAQARRNAASKEIGAAKKAKDEAKSVALMAEVAALKDRLGRTLVAVLGVDSDHVLARREETVFRAWAAVASNADGVARDALADWLSDDDCLHWDETFGPDESWAEGVVVIIHEPAAVAGRYSVDCERTIKASIGRRLDEKESAAIDAILAREEVL